jgi:hypothetical protein
MNTHHHSFGSCSVGVDERLFQNYRRMLYK